MGVVLFLVDLIVRKCVIKLHTNITEGGFNLESIFFIDLLCNYENTFEFL